MRLLRLLVACVAWTFCHAQPSWVRTTDPIALIVSASAAAHARQEPPRALTAAPRAPHQTPTLATRPPAPRPPPPPVQAAPVRATPAPAPPDPLYLLNCALLC